VLDAWVSLFIFLGFYQRFKCFPVALPVEAASGKRV
jgi:hypothetical protein